MRHDDFDADLDDLTPASVLRFGQRNVLYMGFVALLIPFGLALDGPRVPGAQSMGGVAFALMLCAAVSAGFFMLNLGLMVAALARGGRIAKASIGCALPVIFGAASVLVRVFIS